MSGKNHRVIALNQAGALNFALNPPTDMRTNLSSKLVTGPDGKANSALELDLFGYIWDYSGYINVESVKAAIDAVAPGYTSVKLNIHSPGGDVYEGFGVYSLLQGLNLPIHVNILGLAASCASWLAMLGDTITIPEFGEVMIHRVQGGAWGNADQIQNTGRAIQNLEDNIIRIYMARTGQPEAQIRQWMADETYMDGKTAKERGFVTEVTSAKALNCPINPATLAMLGYKHQPRLVENKSNAAPIGMDDLVAMQKDLQAVRGRMAFLANQAAKAGMLPGVSAAA